MAELVNPNPKVYEPSPSTFMPVGDEIDYMEVFDMLRDIQDPEHPYTLEQLRVITEENITVSDTKEVCHITVEFTPTVPHCTLSTLIGLCIREKLHRYIIKPTKIDIRVTRGSHNTENDINKQINDKERIVAALENPHLYKIVESCIAEPEY